MPTDSPYTARFAAPDTIQRGVANTLSLPIYRDRTLQVPTATAPLGVGTLSLFDHDHLAVVDEQAVSVVGGIATYAIAAATLPDTLTLSDRWQERWTLTLGGVSVQFWRDAALGLRRLHPVVTDADMERLHFELRAWQAQDRTSLQDYLDAAWDDICARLWGIGRRPYLIMSPWSLRQIHLYDSLAKVFRDFGASSSRDGKYATLAGDYAAMAEQGWATLKLSYDADEDNRISPDDRMRSGEPVIFTGFGGARPRWRVPTTPRTV